MKDRYMWDPKRERILDMKYRKSYRRMDFKEVFKVLAKTEMRKESLRKMASVAELENNSMRRKIKKESIKAKEKWMFKCDKRIKHLRKQLEESYLQDQLKMKELEIKSSHQEIDITFLKEQNDSIKEIIKKSKNIEEVIEKMDEYHLW